MQSRQLVDMANYYFFSYNMHMNRWLTLLGAVVGGVGLGVIIAIGLIENLTPFCPVCGGRLIVGEDSAICRSCGASLPFKKQST